MISSRTFPVFANAEGYEPWVLYPTAAAVAAHVHQRRLEEAQSLHRDLLRKAPAVIGGQAGGFLDYPAFGSVLYALGLWELAVARDGRPERAGGGVQLLVLADHFGYNRQLPSLTWGPALALAEEILPGEAARYGATLEGRKAPELREDVGALLALLVEERARPLLDQTLRE